VKKARLFIAVLVSSLMLMGIGYAMWNDTIDFNGTAAVGTMDLRFDTGYVQTLTSDEQVITSKIVNHTNDMLTVDFDNLYPGSFALVDMKAINAGTIPMKIKGFNVTLGGANMDELKPYILAAAMYYKADSADNYVDGTAGFTDTVNIQQFENKLNNSSLINMSFNPGEGLYFGVPQGVPGVSGIDVDHDGQPESCIVFYVDPNAPQSIQGKSIKITIQMESKQFNQ
jgi:hypothetical protein